jgi:hypothetical protein
MTSASGGTSSAPTVPMRVMRSPSMMMTLFASGGPPKPSIKRPPTSAIGRAVAAVAIRRTSNAAASGRTTLMRAG